jgi:hypothetical protein
MANVGNGSRIMAIEVCFSFILAVVFDFNLLPVPPSKAKSIGDILTNRQNAATWYLFFLFYNVHCMSTHKSPCVTRRCAVHRKRKSAKLNLKIIDATNLDRVAYWRKVHLYLPQLHRKQIQIRGDFFAFFLIMETLYFTGRKRKYIKNKDGSKLTSIATVRGCMPPS